MAGENHDCVKYGRIKTPYMNNPENNEFNRETAILNKHNVVNVLGYRTIKTVGTFQILSKTWSASNMIIPTPYIITNNIRLDVRPGEILLVKPFFV